MTRERAGIGRLPDLGPRGEGWVAIQAALLVLIGLAGLAGPGLADAWRVVAFAVGVVLLGVGGALAIAGVIRQRRQLTAFPRPTAATVLVDDGPYRLVRHPMYGGIVIGSFGWALVSASPPALGVAAVIAIFFDLKARREEAWLGEQFPGYGAYRARTRRLIPWVY